MIKYIHNRRGAAVAYVQGRCVSSMRGIAVDEIVGETHVPKVSGSYVGEPAPRHGSWTSAWASRQTLATRLTQRTSVNRVIPETWCRGPRLSGCFGEASLKMIFLLSRPCGVAHTRFEAALRLCTDEESQRR